MQLKLLMLNNLFLLDFKTSYLPQVYKYSNTCDLSNNRSFIGTITNNNINNDSYYCNNYPRNNLI